ncbi:methylmalonyl-CoA mutase family protein [Haloechinothrix sp. LS1_15]|uniref:methylmalonyl-CoA mutase family protein n=1 Tax=Haloechinothrix sp. LS1_15 TaxID=2652248 RepID=UPI002945626F|nr:methylmalonyl-CoA mutase family protein [Haloechinothrix sp. LS1_15]MDV6012968.1 methylmalonyl-CoA mutase [Haloechinothrix sp. LS1_15]
MAASYRPSAPEELVLGGEFDTPTREQWRYQVAAALRKTGTLGRDAAPDEPERLLVSTTYDGIERHPLYTAEDVPAFATGLPGLPPYVRGDRPEGRVTTGWDNRVRHADPDPATVNRAVLTDLENGANSVWLRLGEGRAAALPVDALGEALTGVYVDLAPIVLDPGADYRRAAEALLDVFAERELPPSQAVGTLGADPIGLLATTGHAHDVAGAAELAARVGRDYPHLRTIVVDGLPYHEAGGSDAQELAAALATGVGYLRALAGVGMPVADAAAQLEFRYAATADQFLTIAKLRAARRMWARACEVSGVRSAAAAQHQHAVTSPAMLTTRDPWVNMLRGTVACFGAAVGGANAITVLPFDTAIGQPDAFGRRIARNTSSILLNESKLAGVTDPAGGSWYVEHLTDALAHAAWREFQAIEERGGIESVLDSGYLADRLTATWQERSSDLATRRVPLTGVSEYPLLTEEPVSREPWPDDARQHGGLPRVRYAEGFERLRDRSDAHLAATGLRPRAFLATLGPLAAHTARATFTANFFTAGGIEPVDPGETASVAELAEAFRTSGAAIACLCGSDTAYAEQVAEVVAALRAAGAKQVLLAGKPDETFREAGVSGFVHSGCDALGILADSLDTLGVAR